MLNIITNTNTHVNVDFLENGRGGHYLLHIGLAAASFVTNVKKRCREEVNSIPSIYDEEIGSLRNRDSNLRMLCDSNTVFGD